MNRSEQKAFVKSLTESIAAEVSRSVDTGDIPANWDGIELRQLLSDKFAGETYPMGRARLQAYKNVIATTTI